MPTFLFDDLIFGPIKSRRLGNSLGINLLPTNSKLCSFNCIYCECGENEKYKKQGASALPTAETVRQRLQQKLEQMKAANDLPDVITFAGNGEPSMHPAFSVIIADTIELRDQLAPDCKVAVLSNATMLGKSDVFEALLKIDDNIQKLDSAIEETVKLIDCPVGKFSLEDTIHKLAAFQSKCIIQTMFIRGEVNGVALDNTTEKEVSAWLAALKRIKPQQVMLYTISRDTPVQTLEKVSVQEMNQIAKRVEELGISTQVSG